MTFSDHIVAWQKKHGRHGLPWQGKGPYETWLSEIMLQQTQVRTVIPYFLKFVDHYPDITSLAQAPLEDVLALWSGLGYYRRAHHLHRAARIWHEHYMPYPQTLEEYMSLPGVGRSTAGAIMSLALGKPYPIFDGNVRRVCARFFGPDFTEHSESEQWAFLASSVPSQDPGVYNQGLMDLGSGVCMKHRPMCDVCPLTQECKKHMEPHTPKKNPPKERILQCSYMHRSKKYALVQRGCDDIWPALWFFPEIYSQSVPVYCHTHRLTHQHLHILLYDQEAVDEQLEWFTLESIQSLPRPAVLERILHQLDQTL